MAKDMVCPRCGHSADESQFAKGDVAKRSEAISRGFDIIRKVDPTLMSHEATAMASQLHRAERKLKLGW